MLAADTLVLEGRFRVVRSLGSGGMGEVYLGVQVATGRKVAIKALHRDLHQQPEMLDRFRREAKLLSTVDHPSVVQVIEFGNSDGYAYLVMEYVEGENLHSLLQAGLDVPRALKLLAQLAEGLGAIHALGIVHRDLKPENVILSQSGAQGEQARLLDFGIARLVEPEPDMQVSQVGLVIGTPEYLSPEQAMGGKVDARSDLYSFGVLAYQVLSGRLPYPGPGPRHFLLQHVGEAPIPLAKSAPALAAHPMLIATVMRLLEKEPVRRFLTAESVAASFREALATLPRQLFSERWSGAARLTGNPGTAVYGGADDARKGGTMTFGAKQAVVEDAATVSPTVIRKTGETDLLDPSPLPPPRSRRRRVWLLVPLGVVVGLAIGGGAWSLRNRRPEVQARALLAEGRPTDALVVANAAVEQKPELASLRASARHALGEHVEEHSIVARFSLEEAGAVDASLFAALAEDFGQNESDEDLRGAMGVIPQSALIPAFEKLARGPPSMAQWGAMRYLESSLQTEKLELVKAYIGALALPSCEVKIRAARRLGALGNRDAVPALERLRDAIEGH